MALMLPKVHLPKIFLYSFVVIGIIPKLISLFFRILHLPDYTGLDSDYRWLSQNPTHHRKSPDLFRKMLPAIVKFQEMVSTFDGCTNKQDSCAVCLCEFDAEDEIRPLIECQHIFHQSCLDRWMNHYKFTCPLCRTPFIRNNNRFEEIKSRLGSHELLVLGHIQSNWLISS